MKNNNFEREIILHALRKDYVIHLPIQEENIRIIDYLKKASNKIYSSRNIIINENTSVYLPEYTPSSKPVAQYSRFEYNLDKVLFITDNLRDEDNLRTCEVSKRAAERSGTVRRYELISEVFSDQFYVIIADIKISGSGEITEPKGNFGFLNTTGTTIFRVRYQNGEKKKHYSILYKNKDFIAVKYKFIELAAHFKRESISLGAMLIDTLMAE